MNKKRNEAVTMLEALVYIALFGIVFAVMIKLFLVNYEGFAQTNETIRLDRNMIFILNHTSEVIDNCGASFVLTEANYVDDLGNISFSCVDDSFAYTVNGGALMFNRNGIDNRLNIDNTTITRFNLTPGYDKYDELSFVEIEYTISTRDGRLSRDYTKLYNVQY